MSDPTPGSYDELIRNVGDQLHIGDEAPTTLASWQERRKKLREAMFAAMGTFPEKPCPLEPREVGVLKRDGYRIEKLLLQSRPDVWITATAYVPEPVRGKVPGVLAVHGHWAMARRDPVVQARCLGLVKLGFFVLAVDAFGAGERHPKPAPGAYHGALLGSTLWPVGQSLLGLQVYDNRRAVDYLRSRPEVDGDRLGVTGASGGGNQTMYAGALDERFRAAVPVCSVGTYRSYLRAACCVCEVLPGAVRFTEEGDVLGLVAPRALMVINATKDAFQFSVGEAKKSLARAREIYKLYKVDEKVTHTIFESGHAYSQPMREAMYGWMTRWLKDEGDGKPIAEPRHTVDSPEDLACYPPGKRPETFVFPSTFAHREAQRLLTPFHTRPPDHRAAWESMAMTLRARLPAEVLGDFPRLPRTKPETGASEVRDSVRSTAYTIEVEPGLSVAAVLRGTADVEGKQPACVLLHLGGKDEALKHPLAAALVAKDWAVLAPDLRATGKAHPPGDAVVGAPDHNSAEHGIWVGRPLLGQWVCDVRGLLELLSLHRTIKARHLAVVGIGHAGIVAVCAAGLLPERVASAAAIDTPVSFVTQVAYATGWPMSLLAPGLLKVGDVPHLAALAGPRRLLIRGGIRPDGTKLTAAQLDEAFAFTRKMYGLLKAEEQFSVRETVEVDEIAKTL